jgi:hypothetical protein
MTSFWTLQKGYDGASFDDTAVLNPSRAYQFRHGDYFERISTPSVKGDKYMYTRMTDHPEVEEFLRDIQLVVPEDMIWNIVDKNYKVDAIADANIDSQLQSAYQLLEQGVDPVEIENVRYRYEPGEDWTVVPKPWASKDAYLIGKGDENYRITLAPHGETNNKIEKADVIYQLTDNGQWTDETNVAIVGYAPRQIEHVPTFEVSSLTAKRLLHDKDVLDVQLDESDLDFIKSIIQPLDR